MADINVIRWEDVLKTMIRKAKARKCGFEVLGDCVESGYTRIVPKFNTEKVLHKEDGTTEFLYSVRFVPSITTWGDQSVKTMNQAAKEISAAACVVEAMTCMVEDVLVTLR